MSKVGIPVVNQLDIWNTSDGRPSENRLYDCVPASISACLDYWDPAEKFNPDELKDWGYGENWVNEGTAAWKFVPFCAAHGVKLWAVSGSSPQNTVALVHEYIQQGFPVIFTQQDDYSSDPNDTHVCVFAEEDPGTLTCMDPFGGKWLTYSDADWANRLRSNEIWLTEKMTTMIDTTNPAVGKFFDRVADNMWHCKTTNFGVGHGMLDFYRSFGGNALCGLTHLGLPLSNEIGLGNGRTYQRFERAVLAYDPNHTYDGPPGAGTVYLMHIDSGAGQDPRVASLQTQVDALTKERDALKAQLANALPVGTDIHALQAKLVATEQALATADQALKDAIATFPAAPAPTA